MSVFVDTSALFALLDADDADHSAAAGYWKDAFTSAGSLVTSNYVLVETCALVQRRLGFEPAVRFLDRLAPTMTIIWVDSQTHAQGAAALVTADRKRLSLVDCVSFAVMRGAGIEEAFTFDRHFAEQGFEIVP